MERQQAQAYCIIVHTLSPPVTFYIRENQGTIPAIIIEIYQGNQQELHQVEDDNATNSSYQSK